MCCAGSAASAGQWRQCLCGAHAAVAGSAHIGACPAHAGLPHGLLCSGEPSWNDAWPQQRPWSFSKPVDDDSPLASPDQYEWLHSMLMDRKHCLFAASDLAMIYVKETTTRCPYRVSTMPRGDLFGAGS